MARFGIKIFLISLIFFLSIGIADLRLPPPMVASPPPPPPMLVIPPPSDTNGRPQPMTVHAPSAYQNALMTDPYVLYENMPPDSLPQPTPTELPPKMLSLQDAIFLALRSNPLVKISEMQRIIDKYNLEIANRVFSPVYTLNASQTILNGLRPVYVAHGAVSVLTPIGTQYSFDYVNDLRGDGGVATFQVQQPLLQGFGIPRLNYLIAVNTEAIQKLTFKNSIISVVQNVITAYRQVVTDYNNLRVQKKSLEDQELSLKQYRLYELAGQKSRADVEQFEATVVSTQVQYVQTQSQLQTDYRNLLSNLGLVPTANLTIDQQISPPDYKIPSQDEAIRIALVNNVAYQQAIIALNQDKINVEIAENNRKWTLNLVATKVQSDLLGAHPPGNPPGSQSLTFNLTVPIDDVTDKANLVNARIQYEDAKLLLQNQKATVIGTVITDLSTINYDRQQIALLQRQVELNVRTLAAQHLKYTYGRASTLDITTAETNVLQSQVQLIGEEITYQNDVTSFDSFLGVLLDDWNVQLRY